MYEWSACSARLHSTATLNVNIQKQKRPKLPLVGISLSNLVIVTTTSVIATMFDRAGNFINYDTEEEMLAVLQGDRLAPDLNPHFRANRCAVYTKP